MGTTVGDDHWAEEFRSVLPLGTARWHSGIGLAERDATGAIRRMIGIDLDITERKLAEAELQRSEELLQLFVDHSPAAIAMFDRDMNYIAYSRRFLSDYRLGKQVLTGRSHYEVFPDIPEHWKAIHRRCQAGASEHADADPFPRADGHVDWVRWEIHPWHESGGEIGGILLFSEVITERVQDQQRLQDALLRQQALARRLVDVQETERRLLSAELHDRIGQNLTALGLNLNLIARSLQSDGDAATRLRDSRSLIETTIGAVREVISDLRPPVLDDYGLLAALRWLGEQLRERTGLQVSVSGDERQPALEPQVQNALFRIAQETLINVVKHAQAQRAEVVLVRTDAGTRLRISDDGCGFDLAATQASEPRNHWGLEMMRERAEAVGARLRVASTGGQGTTVSVELGVEP